jgi:hypothetical protein
MRRRGRLLRDGCLSCLLALAVASGARALAQEPQIELAPAPPAPVAPAGARPAAEQILVRLMAGNGPELQDLIESRRQQYRALMISELHFCRVACDLTEEQSQRIVKEAGAMIEKAALRAAHSDLPAARRGGIRLAADGAKPDAVKIVRAALLKLVKEQTTPAQESRYQAELLKRAAAWRQTSIRGLVARLDRALGLTTAQRDRLLQIIESNWDDEWGAMTFASMFGDENAPFPAIPTRIVAPLLSVTQRKIWNKLDIQAVVATDVYINYVTEIVDGLPSGFAQGLDAAAHAAEKLPVPKHAPELKEEKSKEGSP